MKNSYSFFQARIALPQDHGSWIFILCPLIIGLFAGGRFSTASFMLILAAMAAFLIRQPITAAVKAYSGRRPRTDLPSARFWIIVYAILLILSSTGLVYLGESFVLILGIPATPIFAWHLWLVRRRDERRQVFTQIMALGVLALVAPAAYWIGKGSYLPIGWLLWVLIWLQSSASIIYAYLRLGQRQLKSSPEIDKRFKAGKEAIVFTTFNLVLSIILSVFKIIPTFLWITYILQFFEAFWGTMNPAIGEKPVSIGIRQLSVTILFTILFVTTWR